MSSRIDELSGLSRQEICEKLNFTLAHVGLNGENEEQAKEFADGFEALFGWKTKVGNSSVFAGTQVEVMKHPFLGQHGHIAVGTSDVDLAKAWLESQGYQFRPETGKLDEKGALKAIYLEKEIGGFSIHLVRTK